MSNKPKIIKDYEKLDEKLVEMVKLVYPRGFRKHLIPFVNKNGESKMGLPFETDDYYYLIRMTPIKAKQIIKNDDDYLDGVLKKSILDEYTNKYDDEDFLGEYNSNDDNLFDEDEVDEETRLVDLSEADDVAIEEEED